MGDEKSLAHTRWNCKYHIVFAPKYRRQAFYGEKRRAVGSILRKLCEWKNVRILEAECCADHIHYMELWTGEGLAANSTRAGTNPGILATYGDGGIVKTDESGVKVPSSLRAIGTRGVYRLGANGGNTGTENRPRNIAFNYIVRAT
ncbi:transposase for insertion sequence element IS200 [Salmonella enterica subsp. enterica serovar Typhi]|nr:transposase for insertion sequence element IS200 [Salmonella enterica subsp. enterica serovar Typhi]